MKSISMIKKTILYSIYSAFLLNALTTFSAQKTELGAFSRFNHNVLEPLAGNGVFLSTLVGVFAVAASNEWSIFQPKVEEWWNWASNTLKGGEYLKNAKKYHYLESDVAMDDMIGGAHVKQCIDDIVNYLENPERMSRMGIMPAKAYLFWGDTRTGKTMAMKMLKKKIYDMQVRTNRSKEILFRTYTASQVQKIGIDVIFARARATGQPIVICMDEIDLLHLQRPGSDALHALLVNLSGLSESHDPKRQIIFIAATNKPETLDFALRAPGRLGVALHFDYPTAAERAEFIMRELRKKAVPSHSVNLGSIISQTEGKSYEGIRDTLNRAMYLAYISKKPLSQALIQEAIDEQLYHIITDNACKMSFEQVKTLAAHFAGRALMLTRFDPYHKLSRVTLQKVQTNIQEEMMGSHLLDKKTTTDQAHMHTQYGALFMHHNSDAPYIKSSRQQADLLNYYCSGTAAEEVLLGAAGYGSHKDDTQEAFSIAQKIASEGVNISSIAVGSSLHNTMLEKSFEIYKQHKKEVTDLFQQHKKELLGIANLLIVRKSISAEDIDLLFAFINNPEKIKKELTSRGMEELIMEYEFLLSLNEFIDIEALQAALQKEMAEQKEKNAQEKSV